MFGPGSNEGAYDYSPFPGTSTRQQQNLKDYDKKYGAAAEKLRKEGYVVNGDNYFKRVPDVSKPGGYSLQRVGKVNTGHNNEALKVTPPKVQNPAAPTKSATDSNGSNGARGENRTTVTPVNGSFRTAVEQSIPSKSEKPEKSEKSEKPDGRVNANGLVSYGKDLSSLNAFTKAFTGGYEVADISTAFQSNDLPGQYKGSNKLSYQQTPYELPEGAQPSPLNQGLAGAELTMPTNSTYQIGEASVPGTLGRSGDAQEGVSDKPDIAEEVRTIRMNRNAGRGSRRDPRNRGEDADMFGGPEPSDASLTSPMYANEKRNKIRSTFLDHEGSSVQAIAAANAVAGYGKDSNADARFNVGGELVYAKEGMQQKAKNAAMMGQDPREFLDIPTTPDTQPDSPAPAQLQSGLTPGSITAPENTGGSIETPAPITKPSPDKFKETQDFLSGKMDMLTRKTK
jgi:hypothetical protein